jgi:hypothetical protein
MRGVRKAFIEDVSSGKAVHSNSAGTQLNSHARTTIAPLAQNVQY